MLSQSQKMFNFSNISTSLYELYAAQFGRSQDRDIAQRMLLLRKGKAALLCPLLIGTDLIGSLELYRFDATQPFSAEVEARL